MDLTYLQLNGTAFTYALLPSLAMFTIFSNPHVFGKFLMFTYLRLLTRIYVRNVVIAKRFDTSCQLVPVFFYFCNRPLQILSNFSLAARPSGPKQRKMNMLAHFICLCPLSLTIKLSILIYRKWSSGSRGWYRVIRQRMRMFSKPNATTNSIQCLWDFQHRRS